MLRRVTVQLLRLDNQFVEFEKKEELIQHLRVESSCPVGCWSSQDVHDLFLGQHTVVVDVK